MHVSWNLDVIKFNHFVGMIRLVTLQRINKTMSPPVGKYLSLQIIEMSQLQKKVQIRQPCKYTVYYQQSHFSVEHNGL